MRPSSVAELSAALREPGPFEIVGSGSKRAFCLPIGSKPQLLDVTGISGIVELLVPDQVVVVRAGTPLRELQEELEKQGQCLPLPDARTMGPLLAGFPGSVGGLVAMNLPHALSAQCGGPRDWVLGLTLVRSDGTIAKCGSKAVKNVAGYDVQKLIVGSRGTLAVIAEVVLRLFPLRAVPVPEAHLRRPYDGKPLWIQRTFRTDYRAALRAAGERLYAEDPASCTIWAWVKPEESLPRFPGDWVIRSGCGTGNLGFDDPTQEKLMRRAKAALDPERKLNPGAMGVV